MSKPEVHPDGMRYGQWIAVEMPGRVMEVDESWVMVRVIGGKCIRIPRPGTVFRQADEPDVKLRRMALPRRRLAALIEWVAGSDLPIRRAPSEVPEGDEDPVRS